VGDPRQPRQRFLLPPPGAVLVKRMIGPLPGTVLCGSMPRLQQQAKQHVVASLSG
jgi:hypothetical protein